MDKREKSFGRLTSRASYVESIVSLHFGWTEDPAFRQLKYNGIIAVGYSHKMVYVYVKDVATRTLVENELKNILTEEDLKWVSINVTGTVVVS